MIITKEEYGEMGFTCPENMETALEDCIKRAEYILNAMCGGTLYSAAAQSESNKALIKQAAAFQTEALLKDAQSADVTRVTLGDLSYTEGGAERSENIPYAVKRFLRAAGCFYGSAAAEVIE